MSRDEDHPLKSFFVPSPRCYQAAPWCPPMDVYHGSHGWLVKLDLAGVRPEEIRVETRGRRLTVRGIRRDCSLHEGQQAFSMEISYNRFERSIELPVDLEAARLDTDYRDGMLLITICTSEAS